MNLELDARNLSNHKKNKLLPKDERIHGWYRFVLGYPPHLVREYLHKFGADLSEDQVLDPFSGTATTPVEARLHGFPTIGVDANPPTALATRVKLRWAVDLEEFAETLKDVLSTAAGRMRGGGLSPYPGGQTQASITDGIVSRKEILSAPTGNEIDVDSLVDEDMRKVIPKGFISPDPLYRVLSVRTALEDCADDLAHREALLLALAQTIVSTAGNLGFGPEVYRRAPKDDADVLGAFHQASETMIRDLAEVQDEFDTFPEATAYTADARDLSCLGQSDPSSIVITSPPYPNEKDYTRSTRLETVLLGLGSDRSDFREIKERLLVSNSRNCYVDVDDGKHVEDIDEIQELADRIEARRIELGKTSGFEKKYHEVTRHYFGGMFLHFDSLFDHLRSGSKLAYVVGDQQSYFRIHIPTAELLGKVAEKAGFVVKDVDLWRTRFATETEKHLNEDVLLLERP